MRPKQPKLTSLVQRSRHCCRFRFVKASIALIWPIIFPLLHYSVLYIFWSSVIVGQIPEFLKIYTSATDEALSVETRYHYENTTIQIYWKILPPKTESFQMKILIFFHISAQNIDCGYLLKAPRRCGSNEYPQSMFLSRNKKNNVYPCKPQFYYIKVGFKGVKIIYAYFPSGNSSFVSVSIALND